MKHFFEAQRKLEEADRALLLSRAKKELKERPLPIGEMETACELVVFNGANTNEYVPAGLEALILPKSLAVGKEVDGKTKLELIKALKGNEEKVLAYVLGNIANKEVVSYFELPFQLDRDFNFPPFVLTHLSDDDLLGYLSAFLTHPDGKPRRVDFFEENKAEPWKSIFKPEEFGNLERGKRPPAILDKPFFSDIHLRLTQSGVDKEMQFPIGKLRTALGYFSKKRDSSGMLTQTKHSLFLNWKDIAGFKIASAQSRYFLGVSVGGEFIGTGQFVTSNISAKVYKPEEIDFFRVRVGNQTVDLTPVEITEIEINLDTQQIFFTRGVGPKDYHIARVQRLRLWREDQTAVIHKVVPFNRGESNFVMAEQFLASRYVEYEKARQLRRAGLELELLKERKVVAGDLPAQLVLSALNTLGVLPLTSPCVGFDPLDLKNPGKMEEDFGKLHQTIRELFTQILDLSQSPNFTRHDFDRLTKNTRAYLGLKNPKEATPSILEGMVTELGDLTKYMDDFFKLNLHNRFQDDLQVDQEMGTDQVEDSDLLAKDEAEFRLDPASRDFISSNFHFFKKRELVQRARLLCEKMHFYLKNIRELALDPNFHPDLVVFTKRKDLITHYQNTAYPAFCLNGVLNTEIFLSDSEEEELLFIQFMRGFTQKVNEKAKELNQSFHHQYKHTLAELTYLADEQKHHLNQELAFLEDPANKEQAYVVLLEKIKGIFLAQLAEKQKNIDHLSAEQSEIQSKFDQGHKRLEHLLGRSLTPEGLEAFLSQLTTELEGLRKSILEAHKPKKLQVVNIYNPFSRAHGFAFQYFEKVLGYTSLFQKALWVRQRQKMFEQVKAFAGELADMPAEKLELQVKKLGAVVAQDRPQTQEQAKEKVLALSKELKAQLTELRNISIKGMFQDPEKERGNLLAFMKYYQSETERLIALAGKQNKVTARLGELENELFKAQNDWIEARVQFDYNKFRLKAAQTLLQDPTSLPKLEELLTSKEEVPKEIRQELNELRATLNEAQVAFKEALRPERQLKVLNYVDLLEAATKREEINELAKEMVNWRQGLKAIGQEIAGEKAELSYLASQEGNLEKVAMSKALPSTRILLKTQYIPLLERETKMLSRANQFLGEVISKEKQLKTALVDGFFRKRHAFPQFVLGAVVLDVTKPTKSHTEKNIAAAYALLVEKYPTGCAPALVYEERAGLGKAESKGAETIKGRVNRIWNGELSERVLFLPAVTPFEEALELCRYKEELCTKEPKPRKSKNSLVLVFVGKLPTQKLREDAALRDLYHQAIMSNIFVDVDGAEIYDNRESIFEALIDQTFGATAEQISLQVVNQFFHGK